MGTSIGVMGRPDGRVSPLRPSTLVSIPCDGRLAFFRQSVVPVLVGLVRDVSYQVVPGPCPAEVRPAWNSSADASAPGTQAHEYQRFMASGPVCRQTGTRIVSTVVVDWNSGADSVIRYDITVIIKPAGETIFITEGEVVGGQFAGAQVVRATADLSADVTACPDAGRPGRAGRALFSHHRQLTTRHVDTPGSAHRVARQRPTPRWRQHAVDHDRRLRRRQPRAPSRRPGQRRRGRLRLRRRASPRGGRQRVLSVQRHGTALHQRGVQGLRRALPRRKPHGSTRSDTPPPRRRTTSALGDRPPVSPWGIRLHRAARWHLPTRSGPPSARAVRDAVITEKMKDVYEKNYGVYGIRKIYADLARQGGVESRPVARCTITRLVKAVVLQGISRLRTPRTTHSGERGDPRPDLSSGSSPRSRETGRGSPTSPTSAPHLCRAGRRRPDSSFLPRDSRWIQLVVATP